MLKYEAETQAGMVRLLPRGEILRKLKKLEGWRLKGKFIVKVFEFDDFAAAMEFVNSVARVAEEQEHHPDIGIRYSKVTLSIQTHSEGGVTEWDVGLARAIDGIR
jgi:4a-hydroxytetrahydrobiopterin dehydratase